MFNSDVVKVEDGIGEKLASFIFYQAAFFSSVIMALVMGWKLALLCLVTFPVTLFLVGLAGLVRLKTICSYHIITLVSQFTRPNFSNNR